MDVVYDAKPDKPRTFQYLRLENAGRRYFCLQQNLIDLIWVLYFQKNPLSPIITPDLKPTRLSFIFSWLRQQFGDIRYNGKILIKFFAYRYQLRPLDEVIPLSFYGQICVPVHKGYKIFDLRRGIVVKMYNQDVSTSSIMSEIEQLKLVSQIDFAPSIGRWNIQDRWFEESYFNGSLDSSQLTMDSSTLLKKFQDNVLQLMKSLVLFQEPIAKNSIEYVNNISRILYDSKLSRQEETVKNFREIKIFIDSVVERLHGEENDSIQLVFSHGDFVPANMLNTNRGMKLVDWEGAMYRSALFDFYSYFFFRPVWLKASVSEMSVVIREALSIFISSVATQSPEVSNSLLKSENAFRWIFYIEIICREVKREMTDTRLDILGIIFGYIETFNHYEDVLAGCYVEGET